MPKARLYFDGDNSGIEKEARIYSLTQEVEDKLDSISDFQDEIDGLQEQINNLASRGRYLSTWDCVTGLPGTDPQVDPYVYRAGDYYIVSNVGGTNLRPAGAEYHVQVPSQVVESQSVSQNDLYIYDGIQWVLQQSGSSLYAVWGSITGTLSAQTDLQTALDNKANITDVNTKTFYIDWSGSLAQRIQEAQAAYDYWLAGGNPIIAIDDGADDGYYILEKVWNGTATFSSPRLTKVNQPGGYTFVTKPGIILTLSGNTVTNVDSQSLNQFYYIDTFATYTNPFAPTQSYHPTSKKYVDNNDTFIGTTAPTDNLVEGRLWYDTANDVLKVYNGTQWNATGGGSDIEYVTQAEYNALLPGAASDGKHYFIYTISGSGGWHPGANTMLYLPMDTDLLDHSGNSLTVNNLGSVSLVSTGTGASVPVAQFNSTSTELTFAYQGNINSAWTISFWENITNQNTNASFITAGSWSYHRLFQIGYTDSPTRGLTLSNYGDDVNLGSYTGRDGTWHLITATYSGVSGQTNNAKVYIDGVLAMQGTMQGWLWTDNTFMIGNYNQETAMGGYLSKFIVETAEWTSQEVSDYFDLTKGDYGIS